jgi:transcriptional regulator with XRE-family HTH domain
MTPRSPTDIDRLVGKRIRLARRLSKVSQQKLASLVGVKYQQIQKYESGVDRVGAGRLHQIAAVLEQPIDFFFSTGVEVEGGEVVKPHLMLNDGIQRLIVTASKIRSRKLIDNLTRIAETFADVEQSEPVMAPGE